MIIDYLLPGRENGISMQHLSKLTGKPERMVRKAILKARIEGEPILSGTTGYFIASTTEEIEEFVSERQKAVKSTCMAIAPLRRKLKEHEQQA